ncbi:hypothetical protein AGLY_017796 [Aphis glycines]|uniref:Uncharacterized protein n=1 Tax=Aphis glycines TaxID=307491 RepID=A0A6G0STV2_APHGL|nr:hypothetical protein AGLY_017796 [Aphis glycines]
MLQFQTLGVVSDDKVNILEVKSEYFPTVFKKIEKNKKKVTEKQDFLRKTSFRSNRFFFYGCKSKKNHYKYLTFSPHGFVTVINTWLNFQNTLTFFDSKFYDIYRKRENFEKKTRSNIIGKILSAFEFKILTKYRNDNDLSSNDFKYLLLQVILENFSIKVMLQFQTLGVVSDDKVNILEVKSEYFPTVFKKIEKNKKKVTEKQDFLRKTSFRSNRFFFYGCKSKKNHYKYLTFSPHGFVTVINTWLNFQNTLTFFELFIYHRNFVPIKKF